ncbi:DUF4190 domain-containing protein [Planosporangium sp. 12N6]|uniref:DUF4190 domain-containing protein n=1 Tax=Planosporangium spinosum TaxID=3402278 RepID=UPI003CF8D714
MTQPPQQPESWQNPPWPPAEQQPYPPQQQSQPDQQQPGQQPYADPYAATTGAPGYTDPYATTPGYAAPGSPAGYPAQPAYGYGYGYGAPVPAAPPTNTLAMVSMILSLVGLGCGITAPVGAIMGHVARKQIRERGEGGAGMALTGIIVGWIITGLGLLYIGFMIVMIILAVNSDTTMNY